MKDKAVLITGATSGIGLACAEAFATQGANLILTGRRNDRLNKIAGEFTEKYNIGIHILSFDVQDNNQVQEAISSLPTEYSAIDILINNAGLAAGFDKIQDGEISNWERMIDTNIKGLLYMTRAILPGMIDRRKGHIINIGSTAGHEVYANGGVYCATKHAVSALTKGIRIDTIGTPIRVTSIDPGAVETEFSIVRFDGDKDKADKVYEGMNPLTGADIADTVLYIATRPERIQIAEVILMPTDQRAATLIHRK
jgi:NADP-dependent 3-hydroxy acid dehydrogenase YdfG